MQTQQEHQIVGVPAIADVDRFNHSTGKAKGILSKVKHKARNLKNKVKTITHTGDKGNEPGNVQVQDPGYHAGRRSTLTQDEDKHIDNSSSDDYDTDEDSNDVGTQLKYEQLRSISALDTQVNGSDVGPNASTLGGAYWKSVDNSSPVSIYKSVGPSNTLQAAPTEYRKYAGNIAKADANETHGGSNFDATQKIRSIASDGQLDMADPDPNSATHHNKIGIFSEDLSTDRKLGVGNPDRNKSDTDEHRTSALGTSARTLGSESPKPSPRRTDGASQQMYRPVLEPDNFASSLTSESINANLYGDVLAMEDKLNVNDRGAQTGDDYPGEHNEEAFCFDKDNLLKMQTGTSESKRENAIDGLQQDKPAVDENADGQLMNDTERWGKWSADKLNNADVDGLALKLGGGGTVENYILPKTKSDVDYFDPNNVDDNKFAEQFAASSANADQESTLLNGAIAGSAAVVEKLHGLKDTIASTLGYGGAPPHDVPHGDGDEHIGIGQASSVSSRGGETGESIEHEDDDKQSGWVEGMREVLVSSLASSSAQTDRSGESHPAGTDSNFEGGENEGGGLSHKWSLDSASDVPQAAFL